MIPTAHESWARVIETYRRLCDGRRFVELMPIRELVERLAGSPPAEKLHAGTSMTALLISATNENLSQSGEPFISVALARDDRRLEVEYVSGRDRDVRSSQLCEVAELDDVLQRLFVKLWNETSSRV